MKNNVVVNEEKELSKNNKSNYSNKNYKVIIAMLLLIIVLLTLVILFLVVNSNNNEDNDKNNNNNEVNDVVNNENEKVDEEDNNNEEINNNNITEIKFNNDKAEVKIGDKIVLFTKFYDENDGGNNHLKINGEYKVDLNPNRTLKGIYLMKDLIVVITDGTTIRQTKLDLFDADGNSISLPKLYENTEFEYLINSATISNNKLKIEYSAVDHGPTVSYIDESKDFYVCDKENEIPVLDDSVVMEYMIEVEYFGNKKFSDINILSKKTYKEVKAICKK